MDKYRFNPVTHLPASFVARNTRGKTIRKVKEGSAWR